MVVLAVAAGVNAALPNSPATESGAHGERLLSVAGRLTGTEHGTAVRTVNASAGVDRAFDRIRPVAARDSRIKTGFGYKVRQVIKSVSDAEAQAVGHWVVSRRKRPVDDIDARLNCSGEQDATAPVSGYDFKSSSIRRF